jgi:alpha-ribazole phosphatase
MNDNRHNQTGVVFLVRHGHIPWDGQKRYVGQSDVPLSPKGRAQAEALGQWFKNIPLNRVVASDLKRTRETAEICKANVSIEVERFPELREIHLGEWEGQTFETVKSRDPAGFRQRGEDFSGHRPPGGENFSDLQHRVMPVFEKLVAETEGNLLIVAHSGVNRVIICRLLGMPLDNLFSIGQDYGGINMIAAQENRYLVKAVNMTRDWVY